MYNILIVEDEADLLEILKFRLKADGYGVTTASDGIEALEKLNEVKPDLIILDINLPRMSGIEFYNKITTGHGQTRYPVLVLTARANLEETFKEVEADGFMPKPFEIDELIKEVERIIKAAPRQLILLIDTKNSHHVQEMTAYLKSERFAVENIEDFTALQAQASWGKADYIIMEYMQEEMSGEAFIKKIKADPFLKEIPVIVYSYSGFGEFKKKSSEAGADMYLGKPQNYDALVTAIKELEFKGRKHE